MCKIWPRWPARACTSAHVCKCAGRHARASACVSTCELACLRAFPKGSWESADLARQQNSTHLGSLNKGRSKQRRTRINTKQGPQQAKVHTYKHKLKYMRRSSCDSRPCKLASAATRPLLDSARRNSAAAAWPSQLCRCCRAIKHCVLGRAHGCSREEHSNQRIYVGIVRPSCISVLLQRYGKRNMPDQDL